MCNHSLDGFINVQETHLHYYPFSQEPTHSQTPSGSSLNKLQMGEEVRTCTHVYAASGFFLHNMGVSSIHYVRDQQYCEYSKVVSM